jgi:hypothetical protein
MAETRHPPVNPGRLLSAFGHIGYNPVSALLDIADNSVSAQATTIAITVHAENQKGGVGRPKAVLKSFVVVDNGFGMDVAGLDNALSLGSSPQAYHEYTLSKFGLGLKSAAASLGKQLEIITRPKTNLKKAFKASLDYKAIQDKYCYELTDPSPDDLALLASVAGQQSGTVIRITELHHDSLPRAADIIDELTKRAGVIYHYYLQGLVPHAAKLSLSINANPVEPFDPLATAEIDPTDAGNLDENSWTGVKPCWIHRSQKIQLDKKGLSSAEVTITQLPHPPSVARDGKMTQQACREKYMIAAGNYGFYIYRNHRLISWADSLGFVPMDQDLYAFRGRFLIDSQADDLLNIDVTKSRIHLSETAEDLLRPLISEAVKKSRSGWNNAKWYIKKLLARSPHDDANEQLDKISRLEDKSDQLDETVAPPDERDKLKQRRETAVAGKPATPEESERLREQKQRVQWVASLDNNQLWERAHDPTEGLIVRVNSSHRFARDLLAVVQGDANLLKVIDLFFFALARGEFEVIYKSQLDAEVLENVMAEYRERVGGTLSEMIRQLDVTQLLGES